MCRGGGHFSQRAHPIHVRQIGFQLPQPFTLLLGSSTLSNVDHSAHKFNQMAERAQNRMTYDANVADGATRMYDAVVRLPICLQGEQQQFPEKFRGLCFRLNCWSPRKTLQEQWDTRGLLPSPIAIAHNPPRKLGECAMPGPYKEAARRLREIAQSQQGFFTTKQATRSGFAEKTHSYHVNAGNWIREHRGIYRLPDFPAPERPDLMLWYLWSQNRQEVPEGAYSHDTALSLHELSDVMPSKLHMTVPRKFRRNSTIPEILVLHRAHLDIGEVQEMHGIRVTRPLRTIVDLLRSGHVDPSQLKLAVDEALRRGLIGRKEIDRMPDDKLQRSLRELAGQPA